MVRAGLWPDERRYEMQVFKEGDRVTISQEGKKRNIRQKRNISTRGTVKSVYLGGRHIRVHWDGNKQSESIASNYCKLIKAKGA